MADTVEIQAEMADIDQTPRVRVQGVRWTRKLYWRLTANRDGTQHQHQVADFGYFHFCLVQTPRLECEANFC